MANQEHLDLLKQGATIWNQWREAYPNLQVDLLEANLRNAQLSGVNLTKVNLIRANLSGTNFDCADLTKANLSEAVLIRANFNETLLYGSQLERATLWNANLRKANLRDANLNGADLWKADLREADLSKAHLLEAHLRLADLSGAHLRGADLSWANLSEADLSEADLSGSSIYAISAWDVQLKETIQSNLIITPDGQPLITVDNLEVAQFIYLLLNNRKIRDVIDTITSKVVLILGRFTPERKALLDALRDELRKQNYSPVLFDFEQPASRDLTETVSILAHLACFIIVDLTDPSSAPHEMATVIPQCVVPVQPLLIIDATHPRYEYAMFEDLRRRYHWVLPTYRYQDTAELLASLQAKVIAPAEQKAKELAPPKSHPI